LRDDGVPRVALGIRNTRDALGLKVARINLILTLRNRFFLRCHHLGFTEN
jgi:hypothetical protein